MRIRVSSPETQLSEGDMDRIERDLEKIDRRLSDFRGEVVAEVRISGDGGAQGYHCTLELDYGRHHLMAKTDHADIGRAVRSARDEIVRQINDRSRGGHSSFTKGK
jgi:ribosome-associated translation inhibitor RaiA